MYLLVLFVFCKVEYGEVGVLVVYFVEVFVGDYVGFW